GIRQPVRRTVGGLGIARHVAAVGVVAEVGELAISHRGDVVATRALGVEGRLAGAVEVRRGDVPGARGRVVLARRTTRVRHAVALGEGRRGGLPLHASDRLVAGVGRRPGRPQVEKVVVPAGEALVLEVAVLDRQLEALPAVPVLHAVGGIGQGNVLAIEARLLGAGARAAVAVDLVAVVAVLARLDVAVPAARRAGRRRARAAGGARPRVRSTGRLLGTGLRAPGAVAVEETVGPGAAARQGRRVGAAVAGLAGLFDAVAALRDGAGAGHGRRHRARTGGAWLPLTARRATVAVIGVAVVALLAPGDDAVAAELVPVVARLEGRGDHPVPADDVARTGAHLRADPAALDLTERGATVAADLVPVVSALAGILHPVPARHRDVAREVDAATVEVDVAAAAAALSVAGAAPAGAGARILFHAGATAEREPKNEPKTGRQYT